MSSCVSYRVQLLHMQRVLTFCKYKYCALVCVHYIVVALASGSCFRGYIKLSFNLTSSKLNCQMISLVTLMLTFINSSFFGLLSRQTITCNAMYQASFQPTHLNSFDMARLLIHYVKRYRLFAVKHYQKIQKITTNSPSLNCLGKAQKLWFHKTMNGE